MTGPEHFREAERLLNSAQSVMDEVARLDGSPADAAFAVGHVIDTAQVHATLALAAANAASQATAYDGDESHSRSRGWAGVA